jgi:hypothetical protein
MKKLYVLVRSDLSKSQQAVQACHAVAQMLGDEGWDIDKCGEEIWPRKAEGWSTREGHLVILRTRDEEMLKMWEAEIPGDYTTSIFYEPNLNNEATAVAVIDYNGKLEDFFAKLPLL